MARIAHGGAEFSHVFKRRLHGITMAGRRLEGNLKMMCDRFGAQPGAQGSTQFHASSRPTMSAKISISRNVV